MFSQTSQIDIESLLNNLPVMAFSKDAKTGKYLSCNKLFANYAQKESPEGVVGLTDFEIFDKETAMHFVEDDKKALSMNEPYVFFEDVPNATGSEIRHLQTTKQKFISKDGRLCTLGVCTDVTEVIDTKITEASIKAREQEVKKLLSLCKNKNR